MDMEMIRSTAVILLFFSTCGCGENGGGGGDGEPWPCLPDEYQTHQVISLPDSGNLGDPDVIKVGDTWYLYPSQDPERDPGFRVWSSTDLINWENRGYVWTPTPDSWNAPPPAGEETNCTYWAPSVHPSQDGFYFYYTANCRIGVAFAQSPLGPFEDVLEHPLVGNGFGGIGNGVFGEVARDYDELAIDPFLLQEPDGKQYLFFAAYSPLSSIYGLELEDYTTPVGSPQELLVPDTPWESVVLEGPWLEKVEDSFHLMYSGNFVHTTDYAIGVARADHPLGPYNKYPQNPILSSNTAADFLGPGHHSVVTGRHGDRLIFYHTDVNLTDEGRRVRFASLCVNDAGRLCVQPPI